METLKDLILLALIVLAIAVLIHDVVTANWIGVLLWFVGAALGYATARILK